MIRNILYGIKWLIIDILIIVAFFMVVHLFVSSLKGCEAKAAPRVEYEWKCCSKPPIGTKNRNEINIIAYNEDKGEAQRQAIWLCNDFFKTKGCGIEYCKQVRMK